MSFEIGDKCFYATFSSHQQVWVECPECRGSGRIRVLLADDEVSIECECCRDGYQGSPGKIKTYEPTMEVQSVRIEGMEIQARQSIKYKILHRGGIYIVKDDRLFTDETEAKVCGEKLAEDHTKYLERQLSEKVKAHKNWAWNVSYHRGRIRQAEKDLVYHRAALAIADKKADK